MYLYFITCKSGGVDFPVKIGVTSCVNSRLKSLQTGNPYNLVCLCKYKAEDWFILKLEKELHLRFKEFRLRGEWFEMNFELLDVIRELQQIKSPPKRANWEERK